VPATSATYGLARREGRTLLRAQENVRSAQVTERVFAARATEEGRATAPPPPSARSVVKPPGRPARALHATAGGPPPRPSFGVALVHHTSHRHDAPAPRPVLPPRREDPNPPPHRARHNRIDRVRRLRGPASEKGRPERRVGASGAGAKLSPSTSVDRAHGGRRPATSPAPLRSRATFFTTPRTAGAGRPLPPSRPAHQRWRSPFAHYSGRSGCMGGGAGRGAGAHVRFQAKPASRACRPTVPEAKHRSGRPASPSEFPFLGPQDSSVHVPSSRVPAAASVNRRSPRLERDHPAPARWVGDERRLVGSGGPSASPRRVADDPDRGVRRRQSARPTLPSRARRPACSVSSLARMPAPRCYDSRRPMRAEAVRHVGAGSVRCASCRRSGDWAVPWNVPFRSWPPFRSERVRSRRAWPRPAPPRRSAKPLRPPGPSTRCVYPPPQPTSPKGAGDLAAWFMRALRV